MPTVTLVEDPSVKTSCSPLQVLQQEVIKAYFATREEKEVLIDSEEEAVVDHVTKSGENLGKIAQIHGVGVADVKRTKTSKYLQIGEIVKVTTKGEKGTEVSYKKLDATTMGKEVYIIVETLHLEEETVLMNIRQGKEKAFGEKDGPITVQQDDKDVVKITAVVGDFDEDKDATNKDDFENWAIAKVKLEPKEDDKIKEWKDGLEGTESKKALLYLLVDVHSENSMCDFKSEYVVYKGYAGESDNSKVTNLFLNDGDAWLEVKKGCDCGKEDFDKQFQCTRYGSVYGPVYWGKFKLANYEYWDDLISENKVTQEEKDILVGMSENEGKLDSVQSYDSELLTVGAMQKTVNPTGKGEFPIQVQEFKADHPEKYKELFEDCGWTVESNTMYYKDPSDSAATKITGSALKTKIREGFKKSEFKKKLKCAPLEPIAKASLDKDFQAKQVKDFIDRLKNKVLPIKPKGYSYSLKDFLNSKLGKATALDHHINRPGYVKNDFGKALDNFFVKKDKEVLDFNTAEADSSKHKSKVSKNPNDWGTDHAAYETIILDDYGVNRRGTDMKGRYNKMKSKF